MENNKEITTEEKLKASRMYYWLVFNMVSILILENDFLTLTDKTKSDFINFHYIQANRLVFFDLVFFAFVILGLISGYKTLFFLGATIIFFVRILFSFYGASVAKKGLIKKII